MESGPLPYVSWILPSMPSDAQVQTKREGIRVRLLIAEEIWRRSQAHGAEHILHLSMSYKKVLL